MAQYNRPPKVKAKGPDEFVSFFDRLIRYFYIHQVKFFVLLLLVVAGFAGYGIFIYYQNYRVKQFATIYQEALDTAGPEGLAKWQDLSNKNPPKNLQDIIYIQEGGLLAGENDWLKAAQAYTQAAKSKSAVLKYVSSWAEAVALENAGQWPEALGAYQQIQQEQENPFKDFAGLGQAQVLMAQGKADQAQVVLMGLISQDAATPEAIKSAAMNKLLSLQLPAATVKAAAGTQNTELESKPK